MPMIDVYASAGTFADQHKLAVDLASTLMRIEQVPDIPMFRRNTAAFVHDLPSDSLSNVDGDSTYVRVQVLTNAGALDRDKQLKVVRQFTDIIAAAAGDRAWRTGPGCCSPRHPTAAGDWPGTPTPTPSSSPPPAPRSPNSPPRKPAARPSRPRTIRSWLSWSACPARPCAMTD